MRQLDGIRAFAVIGVIFDHWSGALPRSLRKVSEALDLSRLGVECFFVLSGFLITLILLQSKKANLPTGIALGHFYVRRILRIFPVYYVTLLVAFFFTNGIRETIAWHGLYLTNIYTSWYGKWPPAGGHFWSLAVEEQFYLLWPLMVLTLPLRTIRVVTISLCLLAPSSRFIFFLFHADNHLLIYTSPIAALDLLCFGGLLACMEHEAVDFRAKKTNRLINICGLIALFSYSALFLYAHDSMPFIVFGRTLVAISFGAVILSASRGLSGVPNWLLGNPVIVWVGTISYGLYIFHPFISQTYLSIGNIFGVDLRVIPSYIRIPIWSAMLLVITAVSYYFFETPIRGLKRFYG